jgi:hypothetical protein
MEDVDFVRACKEYGRLLIAPQSLISSPRRYLEKGIFRSSCWNHLLMLLYLLGLNDKRLYRLYYKNKGEKGGGF